MLLYLLLVCAGGHIITQHNASVRMVPTSEALPSDAPIATSKSTAAELLPRVSGSTYGEGINESPSLVLLDQLHYTVCGI